MNLRFSSLALAVATAALAGVLAAHPASAAPKATPAPSASPSAAPTTTATPEPLDHAIPRLEGVLKANPTDREASIELAQDYLQVNRPDLALPLTQRLLQSGTKTGAVYYFDGYAQSALGRNKEALADFEQAANLEPTNLQVLQALVRVYLDSNRAADAERVAKRALTFNKDSKEAIVLYGGVLATEQKYDAAREQYEAALKIDPKDQHTIVLEAHTFENQNAPALAQQTYDRALAIAPNDPEALLGKARLLGTQHDVPGAMALYDKTLAQLTDPNEKVQIITEEAQVQVREKDLAGAEKTLQNMVAQFPTVGSAHVSYGDFLLGPKRDQAGAEREWTAALGPNRDNGEALLRLGQLYGSKGQWPKAIDQYKRLTEVAGSDPRSWLYLANAYANNHQFDKSRDAFKQSYAIAHSPQALVGLGLSDYQTRNYNECTVIFEALNKNAPDLVKQNPAWLLTLGKCYQAQNQPQKARGAYVQLRNLMKPGSPSYKEVSDLISQLDHQGRPASPAPKAQKKG